MTLQQLSFKEINMSYFESNGWKQDFGNLLKAMVLISKKLEDLTAEIRALREDRQGDTDQEKTTD